ncbi:MAG TPA: PilN domain-containing protein [Thermoanaerobaculia bacterium]|nr:PilN domain-containing protein [Thermoanaerobaculia bacterium]
MIKINLIAEGRKPVVARQQRAAGPRTPLLGGENLALWLLLAGLLVGVGIFGWYFLALRGTINDNDRQIARDRQRVAELQDIIDQVEAFKLKEVELNTKIRVIQDLKNNQRGPVETMDAISQALPELLWLDRMDTRGDRVTVTGRAFNWNAIATFIQNLDDSPIFSEPNLRDINTNRDVFNFALELTKAPPPPVEAPVGQAAAGGGGASSGRTSAPAPTP